MNIDNIISHLSRVQVVTKTSERTKNDYHQLVLTFNRPDGKSDYKLELFINNDQKAIIEDTVPLKDMLHESSTR